MKRSQVVVGGDFFETKHLLNETTEEQTLFWILEWLSIKKFLISLKYFFNVNHSAFFVTNRYKSKPIIEVLDKIKNALIAAVIFSIAEC